MKKTKKCECDIDYKALFATFAERGILTRANYYQAVNDPSFSDDHVVKPLLDWLDFNGFALHTKLRREFTDPNTGAKRFKGSVAVEIACDMLLQAPFTDHLVVFSGEGDLQYAIAAAQQLGKRVTVVASRIASDSKVSDDLRRQADGFIELDELRSTIARPPRPVAKEEDDF